MILAHKLQACTPVRPRESAAMPCVLSLSVSEAKETEVFKPPLFFLLDGHKTIRPSTGQKLSLAPTKGNQPERFLLGIMRRKEVTRMNTYLHCMNMTLSERQGMARPPFSC